MNLATDCCDSLKALPPPSAATRANAFAIIFCGHFDSADMSFYNDTVHVYKTLSGYIGVPVENINVLHSTGFPASAVHTPTFKLKAATKANLKEALSSPRLLSTCQELWLFLSGHSGIEGAIKCVVNTKAKKNELKLLQFQTCIHNDDDLSTKTLNLRGLSPYQLTPSNLKSYIPTVDRIHLSIHSCQSGRFETVYDDISATSFVSATGLTETRDECVNKQNWMTSLLWSQTLAERLASNDSDYDSLLKAHAKLVSCDRGKSPQFKFRQS